MSRVRHQCLKAESSVSGVVRRGAVIKLGILKD